MKTFIALLRGINVSGQKIIKMEKLREVLQELGFAHITTYIQSGNILFQSKISDTKKIEKQIHDLIEKHFGFDVAVIVVTPDDLKLVVLKNPYLDENIAEPQPYVAFLSEIPSDENFKAFQAVDFQKDRFVLVDKSLYIHYADGQANTKLTNALIEKKLKLTSTARNWKTIKKLIELAENIPV